MITQLKIENYKSIQDLTLDVGRVNVLIGENGCGKSNILEAITLAAAAAANKLDNEFLSSRGIRVTEPQLMRSAFNSENINSEIKISMRIKGVNDLKEYELIHNNNPYTKWSLRHQEFIELSELTKISTPQKTNDILEKILLAGILYGASNIIEDDEIRKLAKTLVVAGGVASVANSVGQNNNHHQRKLEKDIKDSFTLKNELSNFVIYSPENTSLRNLEKEGKIQPLGVYGEGLFKLLTVIKNEAEQSKDFSQLEDIQETLELFGWFESIKIPNDYSQLEQKITLQDRYLEMPFDQRSANEGFLLVLFYITLVVSKYTPKIFAIDNIDTSLNPKLCTKLIKELTRLAKKYDKQIFLTSHNPAILDGIDLSDDEQRLFVVSRNKQGHTRCKRIELKDSPKSSVRDRLSRVFTEDKLYSREEILNAFDNSDEPLNLSYALLRGYLGGLPKNF